MAVFKIRTIELFAGVGGFRLGLEGWKGKSSSSNYQKKLNSNFKIVWSNQWEPKSRIQIASKVYENNWGNEGHCSKDIQKVSYSEIPEFDMLVGGFPCQDYSVAQSLNLSKGLEGNKGALWWSICDIIKRAKLIPKFLLLENVDRLLISPSNNRGRDFAIILKSLSELGYAVEWRIINAAEYGMPQKRKRVFIVAYHESTKLFQEIILKSFVDWRDNSSILNNAFPIVDEVNSIIEFNLLKNINNEIDLPKVKNPFLNSGLMISDRVFAYKSKVNYNGPFTVLRDIVLDEDKIEEEFYINNEEISRWEHLKGAKKQLKTNKLGHIYPYNEGKMLFPDSLDRAARTIITGEGGGSPSRFKHVIQTKKGLRRLTPIELERLNMFPDNHTNLEGIKANKRAFFMGNALVVGVVERIGKEIAKLF